MLASSAGVSVSELIERGSSGERFCPGCRKWCLKSEFRRKDESHCRECEKFQAIRRTADLKARGLCQRCARAPRRPNRTECQACADKYSSHKSKGAGSK